MRWYREVYDRIEIVYDRILDIPQKRIMKKYNTNNIDWASMPMMKNYEMEMRVLADLLHNDGCWSQADELKATEDLFNDPQNAEIYRVMREVRTAGNPIDPIHIFEALKGLKSEAVMSRFRAVMEQIDIPAHFPLDVAKLRDMATRRAIVQVCTELQAQAQDFSTPSEVTLEAMHRGVEKITDSAGTKSYETLLEVIRRDIDAIARIKSGEASMGLMTGFPLLDKLLLGLQPGDLIILAARPSVGKSAFALNIGLNVVRSGGKVAYFTLEMSNDEQGKRSISNLTGIDGSSLRDKSDLADNWMKIESLCDRSELDHFFLEETPALSTAEFSAKARQLVNREKVKLIIIDYLQLMTVSPRMAVREQEVAAISRALKATAKTLKIPIIALSQLSRDSIKRTGGFGKPMLSDLRESGSIEQDADTVIFIHRPELTAMSENPEDRNKALIMVAKQRNGTLGDVEFVVDASTMKFSEKLEDLPPEIEYCSY